MNKDNIKSNDYLLKNKIRVFEQNKGHTIYFLLQDDKVVYVGQSDNPYSRLGHHIDKNFNFYSFITCKPEDAETLEALYIMIYRPTYNKMFNTIIPKLKRFLSILIDSGFINYYEIPKLYTKYHIQKNAVHIPSKVYDEVTSDIKTAFLSEFNGGK